MKFAKLSVLALAMGLFVASCGNSETTEETTTVDTVVTPAPEAVAPAPVDTAAAAPADTTVTTTTTTTTEEKH